jgi:GT2 family glycosyltransferase
MKLSVILPCFNGAATIATQLEALANQEYSAPWEVIVSNNGSTDNSMEIVERYRDRLPNLRVVNAYVPPGPRRPVAHSYKVGIEAAEGEAFAFCESDDEVAPGWVAAMGEALSKYDLVAGRLAYERLNPSWLIEAGGNQPQQSDLAGDTSSPPYLNFASGCNFGMTRRLYETVGALDESIPCCYDTDYCWRAQLAGFKLHFVPEALIHYRLRHTPKALYKQGLNWGKDYPALYKRYQIPFGRVAVFKILMAIAASLPKGFQLCLMSTLNIRRGKGGFAWWLWGLGFQVGVFQGYVKSSLQSYTKQLKSLTAGQSEQQHV